MPQSKWSWSLNSNKYPRNIDNCCFASIKFQRTKKWLYSKPVFQRPVRYPEQEISKEIEKDGQKVKIEVIRDADSGGWILEIVDEQWNSTVWDETFPSAKEAIEAGIKAIDEEGISAFIGDKEK